MIKALLYLATCIPHMLQAMEKSGEKPILTQFYTVNHESKIRYTTGKHIGKFNYIFNTSIAPNIPFLSPLIMLDTDNLKQPESALNIGRLAWSFKFEGIPLSLAQESSAILETNAMRYCLTRCTGSDTAIAFLIDEFRKNPVKRVAHLPMRQRIRPLYENDFLHDLVSAEILEHDGEWDYNQGSKSYFALQAAQEKEKQEKKALLINQELALRCQRIQQFIGDNIPIIQLLLYHRR